MANERYVKAIKEFSKALDVDSGNDLVQMEFLAKRAYAHQERNQYADALGDLNSILHLHQANPVLTKEEHLNILKSHSKLNRFCHRYRACIKDLKDMLKIEDDQIIQATIQDIYNKKIAVTDEHRSNADILGVNRRPNWKEVKTRYRQISLQSHPDKFSDAEKVKKTHEFRAIRAAYEYFEDVLPN